MALFDHWAWDSFKMRHYVLRSRLSMGECRRRLDAQTDDPLRHMTGPFVGWVGDEGFELRKRRLLHRNRISITTVQARGVLLEDRHGTEIRLDIGIRRSTLISMVVVALVLLGVWGIGTAVNARTWTVQEWLWVPIAAIAVHMVTTVCIDEPGFLYTEIIKTLQARDVTARLAHRARRNSPP